MTDATHVEAIASDLLRMQQLIAETKLYMDRIERGYAKTRYALELILKLSSGLDKVGTLATIKQLAEKGLESNE